LINKPCIIYNNSQIYSILRLNNSFQFIKYLAILKQLSQVLYFSSILFIFPAQFLDLISLLLNLIAQHFLFLSKSCILFFQLFDLTCIVFDLIKIQQNDYDGLILSIDFSEIITMIHIFLAHLVYLLFQFLKSHEILSIDFSLSS